MTLRILIAAASASVLALAGNAQGQAGSSLSSRFDVAIRSITKGAVAEPTEQPRERGKYYQRWKSVDGSIWVLHHTFATREAARQTLARMKRGLSVPTTQLEGFGDGAFLIAPSGTDGQRRLNFARGRVVVEVSAPGEEGVRRVAARVLQEVDAAIKSGEIEDR